MEEDPPLPEETTKDDEKDDEEVRAALQTVLTIAKDRGIDVGKWFGHGDQGTFQQRLRGLGLGLAAGSEDATKLEDALATIAKSQVQMDLTFVESDEETFDSRAKNRAWRPSDFEKQGLTTLNTTLESLPEVEGPAEVALAVEALRDGPEALARALAEIRRTIHGDVSTARVDGRLVLDSLKRQGIVLSDVNAFYTQVGEEVKKPRRRRNRVFLTFAALRDYLWRVRGDALAARKQQTRTMTLNLTTTKRRKSRRKRPQQLEQTTVRVPVQKKWEEWATSKAVEKRGAKRREFRKALAGQAYDLTQGDLMTALGKYQVLDGDRLATAIDMLADRYAESHDCRFDALKVKLKDEQREENDESSKVFKKTAKQYEIECVERKKQELKNLEATEGDVTKTLWRDYYEREHPKTPRPSFLEFLETRIAIHSKRTLAVKAWLKEKDKLAKLEAADAGLAAPADAVVSKLRSLVSQIDDKMDLTTSSLGTTQDHEVQVIRPSRHGLDFERRLRQLRDRPVVTKAEVRETLGPTAFSLVADPKVAKEALELTDLQTRLQMSSSNGQMSSSNGEGFFFGEYDTEQAATEAAGKLAEEKRKENDVCYRQWKAAKARAARDIESDMAMKLADIAAALAEAKETAALALQKWKKSQHLVDKRTKALERCGLHGPPDERSRIAEKRDKLALDLERALTLRHKRNLDANEATRRWRDLDKQRTTLLRPHQPGPRPRRRSSS